MPLMRWLNVVSLVAVAAIATPALAQTGANGNGDGAPPELEPLPTSIRAATDLTETQQGQVRDYIDQALQMLASDDNEFVTAGRQALLQNYGNVASDSFKAFYGDAVLNGLTPMLQNQRPLIRLNAAIIVSHIQRPQALQLAQQVLGAKDIAVRYWGAKILQRFAEQANRGQQTIDPQQAQTIQEMVDGLLKNNPAGPVAHPALLALAALNTDDATARLLTALGDRLTYHTNNPNSSFRAERDAFQRLSRRVRSRAGQNQADEDRINALAGIAYQYMTLASRQLVDNDYDQQQAESRQRTIRLADNFLRWSGGSYNGLTNLPPSTQNRDPAGVQEVAKQWQDLLIQSPYNLEPQELALPG